MRRRFESFTIAVTLGLGLTLAFLTTLRLQPAPVLAINDPRPKYAHTALMTVNPDSDNSLANPTLFITPTIINYDVSAELSVIKSDSPDPVVLGQQQITYVITATNSGPLTATNMLITDTLPNPLTGSGLGGQSLFTVDSYSLEFNPALPNGLAAAATNCTLVGQLFTCVIDNQPPNTQAILTLQVTPQVTGAFINNVEVSANEPDLAPGNNSASITTTVLPAVIDLELTKEVTPTNVLVGQPMTYTLHIDNFQQSPALGVTMFDNLPAGLAIGPVSTSQGSCTQSGGGLVAGSVSCGFGIVDEGTPAEVTILVTPTTYFTITTIVTNTAQVMAAVGSEVITTNNFAAISATITPITANLRINKTVSAANAFAGDPLTYTLIITNDGPDTATNLVVSDQLPAGVVFGSAIPPICSAAGSIVTCNLTMLAPGSALIRLLVTPTAAGTLVNQAQVSSSFINEPNSGDNSATSSPTIVTIPNPDVSLVKNGPAAAIEVGNAISYTLAVSNAAGADPANGVTLTDPLPAGVVFNSASAGCNHSGGVVACNLGNLSPGSATSPITISVTPIVVGVITNTAGVNVSFGAETNTANNTDVVTTSLVGLAATITPGGGGSITYTDPQGDDTNIIAPAGAVTQTIRLVFAPLLGPSVSPPDGNAAAGNSFTLEAYNTPTGTLLTDFVFTLPVSVSVEYSNSDVANIDDESTLILYYLNGATWVDAATTCTPPSTYQRDIANNVVGVEICHLTEFALFGAAVSSPTYLPVIVKQ